MDLWLSIETLPLIETLRLSRWSYAAVNATHIIGIALLVGGSVPLGLRLIGLWPAIERDAVVRILSKSAGVGLAVAIASGSLLFATRASEYAGISLFQVKVALIVVAAVSAIAAHQKYGAQLTTMPDTRAKWQGALSIVCWLGALLLGRFVAFV